MLRGHEPRWLAPARGARRRAGHAGPHRDPDPAGRRQPAGGVRALPGHAADLASGLYEVLLTATPLLFTGIAVAIAFRAGYWNIGAEGQFLVGAIGTDGRRHWACRTCRPRWRCRSASSPGPSVACCGRSLPAWLKRRRRDRRGRHDAAAQPGRPAGRAGAAQRSVAQLRERLHRLRPARAGYDLPALCPDSRVHWGFGVAVIVIVVTGIVLARTADRAADQGRRAVAQGRRVQRHRRRPAAVPCALVSGAIAGLGGASQVMGVQHQLTAGDREQLRLHRHHRGHARWAERGRCLPRRACLLGDIAVGAQNVSLVLQVPPQLGGVFSALLLLTRALGDELAAATSVQWSGRRSRRPRRTATGRRPDEHQPAGPDRRHADHRDAAGVGGDRRGDHRDAPAC